MKLSLIAAIVALLIFADACTRSAPPDDPVPLAAAAQASCCDYVLSNAGKTMQTKYLSCCLALLVTACPPQPQPKPPTPDAGTGGYAPFATGGSGPGTGGGSAMTPCQQACANLARLGCPEDQATCPAQCELNSKDARFTQNVQCRINATSKTQAQACGIASCR